MRGQGRRRRRLRPSVLCAVLAAAATLAAGSAATAKTGSEDPADVPESTQRLAREFAAVTSLWIAPPSMCVTALLDDDVIFEAQSDAALVPASLAKIVTAAAALEVLGPDGTYTTEVFVRSEDLEDLEAAADGILKGDVYLVGGGDPVLNTPRYGDRIPDPVAYTDAGELAEQVSRSLAAKGIRRIQGRVLGDDSHYPGRVRDYYREFPPDSDEPIWRYSHDTFNFVGPLSGLLINDGYSSYTWKTGAEDRREYVQTTDPPRHAAAVFDDLLESRGMVITRRPRAGVAPEGADLTLLGSIESPPVSQIVARMLTRSDNTIAEMLFKEIGRRAFGSERALAAKMVQAVIRGLLGPLASGVEAADGSGISRHNRLTCAAVAELLRQAGPGSPLVEGLAVAGESGTVKTCRPAPPPPGSGGPNKVYAKTGTLYLSNSLAGAAQARNGETVVFAMIANGHNIGLLHPCNALRRTLLDAAAQYTYGPVPRGVPFQLYLPLIDLPLVGEPLVD